MHAVIGVLSASVGVLSSGATMVGETDGSTVGADEVGATVGFAVGDTAGDVVGDVVGLTVGEVAGDTVGLAVSGPVGEVVVGVLDSAAVGADVTRRPFEKQTVVVTVVPVKSEPLGGVGRGVRCTLKTALNDIAQVAALSVAVSSC